MLTKTLLALSYLTLIPASQSFADYTIPTLSSDDEEFEISTNEDESRIDPLVITALVGTVLAVTAGVIYALNKKGTPVIVVKPEAPTVSSKDALLGSLSEYLHKIETGRDDLLNNFMKSKVSGYKTNPNAVSDQEFSIAFATYFLKSLQNIVGNLPDNHPLTLNLKDSFELLEGGVKAKTFKKFLLTDIININTYHEDSTTALKTLDNQRVFLEVVTACFDSFNKARKDFYDDNRLLSSLVNPNAQSVENSLITAQQQLNQVSSSITQLFTDPSEKAFEGFKNWLNIYVRHTLSDAILTSFPASQNSKGESPNITQYIEDIRTISPNSITSEYLYNKALEKFMKALRAE